jgi:phytoene dehydrogenase-like protein
LAKKIVVIGSGFAGLSAACHLASAGYEVTVLEKNATPGGRARIMKTDGFVFDMGPSWYWMPDVFERFFGIFGKKVSDYYDLVRLDPSYTVTFGTDDVMEVPAKLDELYAMFERYEPGSSKNLTRFLEEAAYKYEVGMAEFVHKPSHSIMEFADITEPFQASDVPFHVRLLKEAIPERKVDSIAGVSRAFSGCNPRKHPGSLQLDELCRYQTGNLVSHGRYASGGGSDGVIGKRTRGVFSL